MKRRLFIAVSALFLLLCAGTIALWARSYHVPERVVWGLDPDGRGTVWAVPGGFQWWTKSGIERLDHFVSYWQIALLTLIVPLWPLVRRGAAWETRFRSVKPYPQNARHRRPKWPLILPLLCVVASAWFANRNYEAEHSRDGADWVCDWQVPLAFGDYYFRVFGTPHPYSDGTYACLILATSIAVVWMFAGLKHRRAAEYPRCNFCGYDIRASKERCPECGKPILAETDA